MGVVKILIRAAILALVPLPAFAWDVTVGPVCRLVHDTGQAQVELTFDPMRPWYTITVTRDEAWPDAGIFTMRFEGAAPNQIATARHSFSDDGLGLTAADRGFGNVLDGLQFNDTAYAVAGDVTVAIPLDGAADPVQIFRLCQPVAGV